MSDPVEQAKRAAAYRAVDEYIKDNMVSFSLYNMILCQVGVCVDDLIRAAALRLSSFCLYSFQQGSSFDLRL